MTLIFADTASTLAQQPDLWTNPITGLIVSLSLVFNGIGVAVIAWGAYASVLRLIESETGAARGHLSSGEAATARFVFATYLLPGLDFLTAGTVIKALAVPDWQQGAVVVSVVVARTLVTLSLRWGVPLAVTHAAASPGPRQLAAPSNPAGSRNGTAPEPVSGAGPVGPAAAMGCAAAASAPEPV